MVLGTYLLFGCLDPSGKNGHRIVYRDCSMGTTRVSIEDPRPFGLPVILTVAHRCALGLTCEMWTYVHISSHIHVCALCMYICVYSMYGCLCECLHACIHACMYVCR